MTDEEDDGYFRPRGKQLITMVQRGVVTQPDIDTEAYFETAKAADLDYVEIMLDGPTDREWLSEESTQSFLEEYSGVDIAVHLPFMGLDVGAPSDTVREAVVDELYSCLEVADNVGTDEAVLHPNALAWTRAHNKSYLLERVIQSIQDLEARASEAKLDIELSVENIYDAPVTLDDFPDILQQTTVSMTFDTGHARIEGYDGDEMADFLETYGDRVSTIHLNDTRDPTDEHLPVGSGTIDFQLLFESLPADWAGNASLEVVTPNMSYVEQSASYLDDVLAGIES